MVRRLSLGRWILGRRSQGRSKVRFTANRKIEEEGAGEDDESTGEEAVTQAEPPWRGLPPYRQRPLGMRTDGEIDDDLSPPLL